MERKIASVKNHIYRNRGKYAFAAGFAVMLKMHIKTAELWNEFLDEHDLTDVYYDIEE